QAFHLDLEDEVERRDLLLDQAPLVDAPGALEEQALRIDREQDLRVVRPLVDLEVEAPARPGEERVYRLLGLDPDVVLELFPGQQTFLDQQLAQPTLRGGRLLRDHLLESLVIDNAIPD